MKFKHLLFNLKGFTKSKEFLAVLILTGVFFFTFFATFFAFTLLQVSVKNKVSSYNPAEVVTPKTTNTDYSNLLSVVFLGQGGEGHSGGSLTDSIIILAADTVNKRATLISVPRDLWVPVPYDWETERNFKVNAAYLVGLDNTRYANKKPEFKGELGAGNMVKYVLENITGVPVSYFVAIDFSSYQKLIDGLGGIDVEVPKTFDDYFYPIRGLENETCGLTGEEIAAAHAKYSGFELEKQFPCRWEHLHWDKGPAKLTGEAALKFVRSRHGDNDYGRSERQFAVLKGVEKKLFSLDILGKGFDTIEDLSGLVRTDMNLATIKKVIEILGNPKEYNLSEIHITEENLVSSSRTGDGQFILVPKAGSNNFEGIKTYIKERI